MRPGHYPGPGRGLRSPCAGGTDHPEVVRSLEDVTDGSRSVQGLSNLVGVMPLVSPHLRGNPDIARRARTAMFETRSRGLTARRGDRRRRDGRGRQPGAGDDRDRGPGRQPRRHLRGVSGWTHVDRMAVDYVTARPPYPTTLSLSTASSVAAPGCSRSAPAPAWPRSSSWHEAARWSRSSPGRRGGGAASAAPAARGLVTGAGRPPRPAGGELARRSGWGVRCG